MDDFVMPLMLALDVQSLTMSLVNIASPTGAEGPLAGSIEEALNDLEHLSVERHGNTVIARTDGGHAQRVLVAARIDTPPVDDFAMAYVEMGKLFGAGACDAKGSVAVMLKAATLPMLGVDVTFVFHASPDLGGLGLQADLALLMGPTSSVVVGDLSHPLAQRLGALSESATAGVDPLPSLGMPVVVFGPGDRASIAAGAEFVPTAELGQCEFVLREWLKGGSSGTAAPA